MFQYTLLFCEDKKQTLFNVLVHIIQEVTNWTGKSAETKSKQKSMNASEKKGDESKVRRKKKSRKEAKEDETLAKRIIIEGSAIERNDRQQGNLQKFQDGRPELAMYFVFLIFKGHKFHYF